MSEAQLKILQMIADGTISATEGETLLDALADSATEDETGPGDPAIEPDEIMPAATMPPKPKWANYWLYPMIAGAVLASMGFGYTILAFIGDISWGWLFLTLPLLVLGSILFLLGWFTRNSGWLHIRVKDGPDRVNISLPIPLGWIGWGVKVAQPFAPQLDEYLTDDVLAMLSEEFWTEGFSIEVNETDGEHVEIFYG